MLREFVMPEINWFGSKSITKIPELIAQKDGNKALIITDKNLTVCGISKRIEDVLDESHIRWIRYDGVRPNPTKSLGAGLLKPCEYFISFAFWVILR